MASDNEASCESDPNFAVICAFMEKFGVTCGLASIDFLELQEMLENTQEVPQELIDLHIKLLRKSRKTVSNERWEKAIIKFCHGFCVQDAWEIERFGYKKARLSSKLRVLKVIQINLSVIFA
jgi:remodeling and spacing factor 1